MKKTLSLNCKSWMLKKISAIGIFSILIFVHPNTATSRDNCAQYLGNLLYYNACQIAELYDITMDEAGLVYVLAANQHVAQTCNFKMTKKFYSAKENLFKNNKCRNAYNYISNIIYAQYIPHIDYFCKMNALHLGTPDGFVKP